MEKKEKFKEELETQYNILIKASAKEKKRQFIIILSILILTFTAVLISIYFSYSAFKNSKNIKEKTNEEIKTYYQTLTVTYNGEGTLNLKEIGNGYELKSPRTIQITNEGNTDITFDIKLTSIKTSLLATNNLVYTITRNNEVSTAKELPLSDKVIASDVKISPSETINFIIKVAFKGTIEENDYSNYYNSRIVIVPKDNKTELLE